MGARRGVVAAAVLWAFWHTPYALSGIQHVEGISIALMAAIMPIGIVGSGLVMVGCGCEPRASGWSPLLTGR
jgi:hypothetical protein